MQQQRPKLLRVSKDNRINLMPQASPVLNNSKHAGQAFKETDVPMHMLRSLTTIMDDILRYDANFKVRCSQNLHEKTDSINHCLLFCQKKKLHSTMSMGEKLRKESQDIRCA